MKAYVVIVRQFPSGQFLRIDSMWQSKVDAEARSGELGSLCSVQVFPIHGHNN